jgi:hypothetical protein
VAILISLALESLFPDYSKFRSEFYDSLNQRSRESKLIESIPTAEKADPPFDDLGTEKSLFKVAALQLAPLAISMVRCGFFTGEPVCGSIIAALGPFPKLIRPLWPEAVREAP